MSGPAISLDLSFNLIQVLRLAHALVEAGCRLHVAPKDAHKVRQLWNVFGMPYEVGSGRAPVLPDVSIDHLKPETRVGSLTRALIFPFAAFEYCRERWPGGREVRACFPGLLTAARRKVLNAWLERSGLDVRVPEDLSQANLPLRIVNRAVRRLGFRRRHSVYTQGVKFDFSDDGRVFPRKAWNSGYYASLLESEFILCPSGDFAGYGIGWTYRFFESIVCGAIPVVEDECAAYAGFRFRSMAEPLEALRWSYADAEHNFALALERMTIPREILRAEVSRLLMQRAILQPEHAAYATPY